MDLEIEMCATTADDDSERGGSFGFPIYDCARGWGGDGWHTWGWGVGVGYSARRGAEPF